MNSKSYQKDRNFDKEPDENSIVVKPTNEMRNFLNEFHSRLEMQKKQ